MDMREIRNALCRACPFVDHCAGWESVPYCLNPSARLLSGEALPEFFGVVFPPIAKNVHRLVRSERKMKISDCK